MDFAGLQRMKREGRKIVGVVAWDCPMAQIAERAGADLLSVGDSVGVNLWGQREGEITLEEMLVVLKAVRRGVKRALLSCDLPPPFVSAGNAKRLLDAGADAVKVEAGPAIVEQLSRTTPVFAEFHGGAAKEELVEKAKQLESAGAVLLDFRHSGPAAGAAVAQAVSIPVLGGLGGGPWLDGRLRMAHAAIGYSVAHLDSTIETYANAARLALDAIEAYADDVRCGRQLKGQRPA